MGFSSWSTVGEEGGVRLVVVKGREGRAAATGLGDDVDASVYGADMSVDDVELLQSSRCLAMK